MAARRAMLGRGALASRVLVLVTTLAFVAAAATAAAAASADHHDANDPHASATTRSPTPAQRAKALLANLTSAEKVSLLHGVSGPYVGQTGAIPRVGIPPLLLNDGPQGFRGTAGTSTQWPSGMTVGTSWDRELMHEWGVAMGQEFRGKGANVFLGPGVNVARVPRNGRTFEYISGEDPHVGSQLVAPLIHGVQSQNLIATVKHYVGNNEETNRGVVSANVDERTRAEIYAPPFEAAVQAGTLALMCSYNRVNDQWACENEVTLRQELLGRFQFEGVVMSDWFATHSTATALNNGLGLEMPGALYLSNASVPAAIAAGKVTQATVDDKVLRLLTAMFTIGMFDAPPSGSLSANVTSVAHNQLARKLAAQSTVLLKNADAALPLDLAKRPNLSIAVIGAAAHSNVVSGGGGSGGVTPAYTITPLDGIAARMEAGGRAPSCKLEPGIDYWQPLNPSAPATSPQDCCSQCSQKPNCTYFTYEAPAGAPSTGATGTCWFKTSNSGRRNSTGRTSGACAQGGRPVVYDDGSNLARAAAVAEAADVAIVVGAAWSMEAFDRGSLSLPSGEDELIAAVAAVQPRTVAVVITPGQLLTPWANTTAAVVSMHMPGQEEGNALADVLFGDVNPSARLTLTYPNVENEVNFTVSQYPGLPTLFPLEANYTERLNVGYRWYATHAVTPKFAFGHGLSYTTFGYASLSVASVSTNTFNVSAVISNTGSVAGAEVAQLYIKFPAAAGEPPLQLRGFDKVMLQPGASATVSFPLAPRDFSIWDATAHAWAVQKGDFVVMVGASSQDVRLHASVTL